VHDKWRARATIPEVKTKCFADPFRCDLAAAIERAEHLARENAALRAERATVSWDLLQWSLMGLVALCGLAIVFILTAGC
jgi:hypothetical protein